MIWYTASGDTITIDHGAVLSVVLSFPCTRDALDLRFEYPRRPNPCTVDGAEEARADRDGVACALRRDEEDDHDVEHVFRS